MGQLFLAKETIIELIFLYMSKDKAINILKKLVDCNGTRTHSHLVCKRTLNHLASFAKWLSVCLRTKWMWVRVPLQSLNLQLLLLF